VLKISTTLLFILTFFYQVLRARCMTARRLPFHPIFIGRK